jgi:tRNA 2-thiouridine synthesizing protein B
MSILHIVRNSAFSSNDLIQCLALINEHDTLALIDDGCYNVNHPSFKKLTIDYPRLKIKVMMQHANARAVIVEQPTTVIEMKDLVELTFTHENVITWQ